MDDTTREALSGRKTALTPLIRSDGIEAVVWRERDNATSFTLTKLRREPAPEDAPFNNVVLDAPKGETWRCVAECAFKIQEAASLAFGDQFIDVQLDVHRCRVEAAGDRNRTQMMAVVVMSHPVIKSFGRMVRGSIKRLEKADLEAAKRERVQQQLSTPHQDSL